MKLILEEELSIVGMVNFCRISSKLGLASKSWIKHLNFSFLLRKLSYIVITSLSFSGQLSGIGSLLPCITSWKASTKAINYVLSDLDTWSYSKPRIQPRYYFPQSHSIRKYVCFCVTNVLCKLRRHPYITETIFKNKIPFDCCKHFSSCIFICKSYSCKSKVWYSCCSISL